MAKNKEPWGQFIKDVSRALDGSELSGTAGEILDLAGAAEKRRQAALRAHPGAGKPSPSTPGNPSQPITQTFTLGATNITNFNSPSASTILQKDDGSRPNVNNVTIGAKKAEAQPQPEAEKATEQPPAETAAEPTPATDNPPNAFAEYLDNRVVPKSGAFLQLRSTIAEFILNPARNIQADLTCEPAECEPHLLLTVKAPSYLGGGGPAHSFAILIQAVDDGFTEVKIYGSSIFKAAAASEWTNTDTHEITTAKFKIFDHGAKNKIQTTLNEVATMFLRQHKALAQITPDIIEGQNTAIMGLLTGRSAPGAAPATGSRPALV